MKDLKEYMNESLADRTNNETVKTEIINWIEDNVKSIKENKLSFDFNTTPVTVDYDGNIEFKEHITSLTNGTFQWGVVGGNFICNYCKKLTSLKGAPEEVGKTFSCRYCNSLKSLDGSPRQVGGNFYCLHCKSLVSLNGSPNIVGNHFDCVGCNSLMSLEGSPVYVGGYFDCSDCGINFTENDVKIVSKVKGKIIC